MRNLSPILAIALLVACGKPDEDGDGFGSDIDCNDSNANIFPGATEICDGADNDCDGEVDGQYAVGGSIMYVDADGDGYGGSAGAVVSCEETLEGYAAAAGDCNDADAAISPGADEVCNDADDNCNGLVDDDPTDANTYHADLDGDGYGSTSNSIVACEMPSGYIEDGTDCNDVEATINPSATEMCDLVDNDCDGDTDEDDAQDAQDWYADTDKDGYGNPDSISHQCYLPENYSADNTDCDDTVPEVNPGAEEECFDGLDNNCSGTPDHCSYTSWSTTDDAYTTLYTNYFYKVTSGDFNGDGYTDLATAYRYGGSSSAGEVYVYYGTGSFPSATTTVDATFSGDSYSYTGASLAAGDIDADGTEDLIVGANGYSFESSSYPPGAAYAVFGDATTNWTNSSMSDLVSGLYAEESVGEYDYTGSLARNVGDLDGDGNDDFGIGAAYADRDCDPADDTDCGYDTGTIYLVYGGAGLPADLTGDADAELHATSEYSYSSTSSGLGYSTQLGYEGTLNKSLIGMDFDGDGNRDLVAGAPYAEMTDYYNYSEGAAWIIYGDGTQLSGSQEIGDAADTVFSGAASYDYMGRNIHGLDINGDGYDDLLTPYDYGKLAIFEGSATRWVSGTVASATRSLSVIGDTSSNFGWDVVAADIDGDLDDEFIMSAISVDYDGNYGVGALYIFEQGTLASAASADDADAIVYGTTGYAEAGSFLGADDVDGDGVTDLIVGMSIDGIAFFQGVTE